MEVSFINSDKKFIIQGISGILNFDNQIDKCLKKKKILLKN